MLDRKLLRDLWRLRTQALAIAVVVGAGVALLIATFGCLASLERSRDDFYEHYRFADLFATLKRAPDSMIERLRLIDGVAQVETRVVADVTLDLDDMAEPGIGRLISIPENGRPLLNDIQLKVGRLVMRENPGEVIAAQAFAEVHQLKPGSEFYATMNGKKRLLTVVGVALTPEYVYTLAPGQFMPDNKRFGILWMGRKALAASFDLDGAFNNVTVTLRHGAIAQEVSARIDDALKPYGSSGVYGRKDQTSHFFLSNELMQLKTTGTIVPPIFLAIAAFLLNVVLTRLIAIEREQIGLLKAFGYGDAAVGWHYAKMMLTLIAAGLAIGLICGIWLGREMLGLYSRYYQFPLLTYRIEPKVFSLAVLITLVAGLTGGFQAVRAAARLSPAVAMAPPVPTTYRRTRATALFGAVRVSQPTRMIFRHLMRWPVRTIANIIGIAAAVGLLVASLFFLDTVKYVIDVVFFQAERQTLTVAFVEPRPAISEVQIQRLPGVLATQPVRTVSARLRNGPYSKRMFVSGLPPQADLNRLLDVSIRPVAPPGGGIAISRHVAEELHAKLGDTITVEVMQERRPIRDLPITQIVEQYMGFGSYMSLENVNELMLEGPMVSAVHVLADARNLDDLYRHLKNMPGVAGIAMTTAALTGFRTTMANTMYVVISFYIGFASLIAVGVLYNSARIAFSERAHVLASLRVLGFTSAETIYILLGELGILTLLALPVGCILGYGLARVMSPMLKTDMYSFPMIINPSTYALAMLVVICSAVLCGTIVARRVHYLDLITVLKARD